MAIGSAPEIGTKFGRIPIKDGMLDHEALMEYYAWFKKDIGPDGLTGWGSLHFPPRYPNGDIPEGKHPPVQPPASRES
jgi:hypothetical protein